jgi:hypothetical protein
MFFQNEFSENPGHRPVKANKPMGRGPSVVVGGGAGTRARDRAERQERGEGEGSPSSRRNGRYHYEVYGLSFSTLFLYE